MEKGRNWIHVKLAPSEYDFFMSLCGKFGGLDESGMIKEMIRSYADDERGVDSLYEKRVKAERQTFIDESLMILGRQFLYTNDPDDFDSFKEECEKNGRVPEEIISRTEVSLEVKEIVERLGDLNDTESAILQIMEPGLRYTKKYLNDEIHRRIKTSDSAINRARKNLGIQFEKRKGFNGNIWYIPKKETGIEESSNSENRNMKWVVMDEASSRY